MTYVPFLTYTYGRRYSLFVDEEGLRRPLADICMLCFHLVISSVTYKGVDLQMARKILEWNLKRFPDGEQSLPGERNYTIHGNLQAFSTYSAKVASAY